MRSASEIVEALGPVPPFPLAQLSASCSSGPYAPSWRVARTVAPGFEFFGTAMRECYG